MANQKNFLRGGSNSFLAPKSQIKWSLKSADGKDFGDVSAEAYRAVYENSLHNYKPKDKKEESTIAKFRKHLGTPLSVGDSMFGNVSYDAYIAIVNGKLDDYKPVNNEEKKVLDDYKKSTSANKESYESYSNNTQESNTNEQSVAERYGIDANNFTFNDLAKWANEHNHKFETTSSMGVTLTPKYEGGFLGIGGKKQSTGQEDADAKILYNIAKNNANKKASKTPVGKVLDTVGYTAEKVVGGAADAIGDMGDYALAGMHWAGGKAAEILLPENMEGAITKKAKEAVDYRLNAKTLGDVVLEDGDKRFGGSVPKWYKEYIAPTAEAAGAMTPAIIAEVLTLFGSPMLDLQLAKMATTTSKLGTTWNATKNVLKQIATRPSSLVKPSEVIFGTGAAASATKQAYGETGDFGKSVTYGLLTGLGEVATERLFGGFAGTEFGEAVFEWTVKNKALRKLLNIGSEAVEEMLMTGADTFFKRATIDPNAALPTLKEMGESGLQGILLSTFMGVGTMPVRKMQKTKAINTINTSVNSINELIPNPEAKITPLDKKADYEAIEEKQKEIRNFTAEYADAVEYAATMFNSPEAIEAERQRVVAEAKELENSEATIDASTGTQRNNFTGELDEIASTEMPSVNVGDSFFDKKLNISIKVMGRDANNTTIETTNLSTGAKETKPMPNNMADSLLVDDRYTKVETPATSTTEESSEASDTQAPKNINLRKVGKNYEVYGNDALTLASEIDDLETTRGVVNGVETDVLRIPANLADGLAEAFDGEYNLVMNDKPVTTTSNTANTTVSKKAQSAIPSVRVGEVYKSNDTDESIAIVGRDAENTTVLITNSKGSRERAVSNKVADAMFSNTDKVKGYTKTTSATANSTDTTVYNMLTSENLTNKQIDSIISNPTLRASFEKITGVKIEGSKAEQRNTVKNAVANLKKADTSVASESTETTAKKNESAKTDNTSETKTDKPKTEKKSTTEESSETKPKRKRVVEFYGENAVKLADELDMKTTKRVIDGVETDVLEIPEEIAMGLQEALGDEYDVVINDSYTKSDVAENATTTETEDIQKNKRLSLSSMGSAFFGNEKITSDKFESMLEDGSYKEHKGYKDYLKQVTKAYKQSRGLKNVTESDIAEIERQIEGIIKVAIAAKRAGYDILDDGEKRTKKDSKKRLLFSSLEPNSDYVTSSDIATICDKAKNFTAIHDEIIKLEEQRGVPVDKRFFKNIDNYFILHKLLSDKGLTIPCDECYVQAMRKNLTPMADAFRKLVQEEDANNKGNEQLYHQEGKDKGNVKKNNAEIRKKVRTLCESADCPIKLEDLTLQMLTTADGLTTLRCQAPLLYETFNSFYGQSKPKMPREATPFRPGELIAMFMNSKGQIKTGLVNKIKATGGFRLQSYSDFQIDNFVDVLQTIFEASMVGLNGHAYTKVPAFLEATEGTNLKRNISIFMYEDNGEWKLDKKNSFPMELEDIYALVESDESGNTGIIAVSQNEDMSAWIMANDFVGYGIPFHKSGTRMEIVRGRTVKTPDGREVLGYVNQKDHTKQQTEVWKTTLDDNRKENTKVKKPVDIYKFWDFENKDNLSQKELIEKNLKRYIDECNKNNYRPKFRDYVMNKDGILDKVLYHAKKMGFVAQDATIDDISFKYDEYTIPYGYYKFLGDFGMFKPDGTASPIETLSLENYDFDKAVDFFKDSGKLKTNELLQQFENGEVRDNYRKMVEDGDLTAEQLGDILKAKRNEIVQDVVNSMGNGRRASLATKNTREAEYLKAVEKGDMETAQRMVDEVAKTNGYKISGHHGTDVIFTNFDRSKTSESNDFGQGLYFTSSEVEAQKYQNDDAFGDTYNKIYNVAYDNALEKIEEMGEDANDDDVFTPVFNEEFDKELKRRTDEGAVINAYLKMDTPFVVSTSNWITEAEAIDIAKNTMYVDDIPNESAIADWVHSIKSYAKQHNGEVDTFHFANNMGHAVNLTNALMHHGKYDGILDYSIRTKFESKADYHAIAFYPNKIKDSAPVTYDNNGNVIPLSERFNESNDDIRYSKSINAPTIESEENNNERKGLLSENGRGEHDESTRKQTERISRFERENKGKNARERRKIAREILANGQVEEVVDGNDRYTLIKPEAYNDDMLAMVENAKSRDKEIGFFIGDAIIDYETEYEFFADGIKVSDTKILVQYDGVRSPQRLIKHEEVHTEWDTPEMQAVKDEILNDLSESDKEEILSRDRYFDYMDLYDGKEELVLEEFVADVMSGMNDYTTKYIDTVTDYWYGNESAGGYTPSTYAESIDAGGNQIETEYLDTKSIKRYHNDKGHSLYTDEVIFSSRYKDISNNPDMINMYNRAKKGEPKPAYELISKLLTEDALNKIESFGHDTYLMPIVGVEGTSANVLPRITARYISEKTGQTVFRGISKATVTNSRKLSMWDRMKENYPSFTIDKKGNIKLGDLNGKKFVLIDDNSTTGRTFIGLKNFLEENGGEVVGYYALTTGQDQSEKMVTTDETWDELLSIGLDDVRDFAEKEGVKREISKLGLTERETKELIRQFKRKNVDTGRDIEIRTSSERSRRTIRTLYGRERKNGVAEKNSEVGHPFKDSDALNVDNDNTRYSKSKQSDTFSTQKRIEGIAKEISSHEEFIQLAKQNTKEFAGKIRENKSLQKRLDNAKRQMLISPNPTVNPMKVAQVTKEILKEMDSTLKAVDLKDEVISIYNEYFAEVKKAGGVESKTKEANVHMIERFLKLGVDIADSSEVYMESEEYMMLKSYLKSTNIKVPDYAKGEADYAEFRKSHMGTFNLTNDGLDIDVVYQELCDMFPGMFDAEIANPTDQLYAIADKLESLKPYAYNPHQGFMQDAIDHIAFRFISEADGLAVMPKTKAQKMAEKSAYDKEKALDKEREAFKRKLERNKEKYEDKIHKLQKKIEDAKYVRYWEKRLVKDEKSQIKDEAKQKLEKTKQELKAEKTRAIKEIRERQQVAILKSKIRNIVSDMKKKLDKTEKNGGYPKELVKAVAEVCSAIDFHTDRTNKDGSPTKTSLRLDSLMAEYIALKNNENYDFASEYRQELSDKISNLYRAVKDKRVVDLNLNELSELKDILSEISHSLSIATQQIGKANAKANAELAWGIIESVEEKSDLNDMNKRLLLRAGKLKMQSTKAFILNPHRINEMIAGYDKESVWWQLHDDINRGNRKSARFVMEANKPFDELTNDGGNEIAFYDFRTEKIKTGIKYTDGTEVEIPKSIICEMLMMWNRKDGKTHLETGGAKIPDIEIYNKGKTIDAIKGGKRTNPITVNDIVRLRGLLDSYDLAWIERAYHLFNKVSQDAINSTSIELVGRELARSENYIRMYVDSDFVGKEVGKDENNNITLEGHGSLKETKPKAKQPLLFRGIHENVYDNIDFVSKYYGLAIPIRNFNKVYRMTFRDENGQSSVQEVIGKKFGAKIQIGVVEQYIKDLQTPRSRNIEPFGGIRGKWLSATFWGNISSTLKQTTSYWTAAAIVGEDSLVKGLKNFAKSPKQTKAEISKHSGTLYKRSQGLSTTELGDRANRKRLAGASNMVTKLINEKAPVLRKIPNGIRPENWLQSMDCTVSAALWEACKVEVSKTMSASDDGYMQAVTDLWERVIEETQSNYDVMHRPEALKNTSTTMKTLTMFQTDNLQQTGIIYSAFGDFRTKSELFKKDNSEANQKAKDEAKTRLEKAIRSRLWSAMWLPFMTFMGAMLLRKFKPYKDEEENDITASSVLKQISLDMCGDMFGVFVPIGGELITKAVDTWKYGYDFVEDPAFNAVQVFIEATSKIWDEASDGGDVMGALVDAIPAISNVTGLPIKNISDLVKSIRGYVGDIKELDFAHDIADYKTKSPYSYGDLASCISTGDAEKEKKILNYYSNNGKEVSTSALTKEIKPAYVQMYIDSPEKARGIAIKLVREYKYSADTINKWAYDEYLDNVVSDFEYAEEIKNAFQSGSSWKYDAFEKAAKSYYKDVYKKGKEKDVEDLKNALINDAKIAKGTLAQWERDADNEASKAEMERQQDINNLQ